MSASLGISGMSDSTKMMLFMFLGMVVAILVLGFSRSPKASPATGARLAGGNSVASRTAANLNQPSSQAETYPSNNRPY